MEWRVPLADLDYDETEASAVMDVLRTRWLTMGGVTQAFESEFAAQVGTANAVAVTNATVALHLACLALGIGPGDEVILPSLTFVATANAVLYTGASVRFADVCGPHDLTLDPASVESLVNPRTRALIPMHYGGYPCHMPALLEIASRHGLAVIEDAAHAPGASLDGRALGAWGDIGCFSFFSNKNLSTGEGGMLVTHRHDLAQKLRLLRSHGMTSLTWDRHHGHASSYDVVALGYNYRIDEIHSALGRVQLHKLPTGNARRRDITARYWQAFASTPLTLPFQSPPPVIASAAKQSNPPPPSLRGGFGISEAAQSDSSAAAQSQPPPPSETIREIRGLPCLSAAHLFPILLPPGQDRRAFMEALRAAGIQTSIHYPPVHTFTYYQGLYPGLHLPVTEDIAAREVTLPLYPSMSDESLEHVIQAVLAAL